MSEDPELGTFGRFVETPLEQMDPATRAAYDLTRQLSDLVPGPHRIWLANPALAETIAPVGAYFQTRSTLTRAEIEIAACIVTGRWRAPYATTEHERIGEDAGGLDPREIQALITGLPAAFDDVRQQVVYELASTLVAARVVPLGLFRRGRDLLGDAGIVDLTVLLGWFMAVSLTLTAYDVPSDATGLDQ
jgi:4-carboxymuconolactone decarboxylase